ncbi:hypothetical protein [Paraburkholderia silvatlantica]|uniref:hypothetical protein n=1 Tax=Paraburkholderia silvatlantica TaxID=321895 RepID=UPI0037515426
MENTRKTTATRIALSVIAIAALAACGSKPSESDVRDSLEKNLNLASCDLFKLTKLDKVNGQKVGDDHYMMQVEGAFVMKPLNKNVELLNDADAYIASNKDVVEAARKELNDLGLRIKQSIQNVPYTPEQMAYLAANPPTSRPKDEEDAVWAAIGSPPNSDTGLYFQAHPDELATAIKDAKVTTEFSKRMAIVNSIKNTFYQNIAQECPSVDASLVRRFFSLNVQPKDYKDDLTYSFQATYSMVKTDNGWQIDN